MSAVKKPSRESCCTIGNDRKIKELKKSFQNVALCKKMEKIKKPKLEEK